MVLGIEHLTVLIMQLWLMKVPDSTNREVSSLVRGILEIYGWVGVCALGADCGKVDLVCLI